MPINSSNLTTSTTITGSNAMSAANPGSPFWQGYGFVDEVADAAESTATSYSLLVGQSAYGTLSSGTDEDWFAVQLVAGQTYEFRMLGWGETFLTDPYLRLMDASGAQLAVNDDGFTSGSNTHERDSRLTFTATTTGTYYLQADAFSNETGDYLLTAAPQNPTGMIFTVDEIAWQLINNGNAFFASPEAASFNVGVDNTLTVNISGLTAQGQYLAQQALLAWTNVTGINFQVTAGAAEITFDDNQAGAFAQPVYSGGTITSATVNIGTDWLFSFGTTLDSYSFETYIHEIGHALGLGHGGNYNGSASYGTDNYYLNDSLAWSIMSYMQAYNDEFDSGNPGDVNTYVAGSFRYVFTPQIADIIAIQHLYGSNTNAFTGNTTYGFNGNTGVAAIDGAVNSGSLMAMTVYDDGGTDTLNFSNYASYQLITLYEESLSSVLGGSHNLGIARGTVIENAIGGSGDDDIYGNDAANNLQGRNGSDYIYGGGGNDTLIGGANADYLNGGADNDTYILDSDTTDTVVDSGGSADSIHSTVTRSLETYVTIENLVLAGTGNINGTGNALANRITGNAGNNVLFGGMDSVVDTLEGGQGNDSYILGGSSDIVVDSAGTDTIYSSGNRSLASFASIENLVLTNIGNINGTGNALVNRITGNAGNNTLNGGVDLVVDTLVGGAGNDIYVLGIGSDIVNDASGIDTINSSISRDLTFYGTIENLTLAGTGNINGTGNALVNRITGNAGNNTLNGGVDLVVDTLVGGAGNDIYVLGIGSDIVNDASGIDTINSSISRNLTFYGTIENLTLAGTGNINGTGNTLVNRIIGNTGNNTLNGGLGSDVLTGGAGLDSFAFSTALSAANVDQITDYNVANDTIRIDNAIFTTLALGNLAAGAFASNTTGLAGDASDRIIYETDTGRLYYDANGLGGAAGIHFATLSAGLLLTQADFVVF